MNPVQIHLIFTHLPIVGLGFAIMINVFSLLKKHPELQKLSLWTYVVLGVFAMLAYVTGDGAEKLMKTYPGIGEELIQPHERFALVLYIGLMTLAAVSIIGIYLSRSDKKLLKKLNLYLFIASMMLSFFAVKTGATGGKIRHNEIEQGYYNKEVGTPVF